MSIAVNCTCGVKLKAKNELAGKRVKCPMCGSVVAITLATSTDGDALGSLRELPAKASPIENLLDEELFPHPADGPTHCVNCPGCGADMARDVLLCVACGYHLETGRYLKSVVEARQTLQGIVPNGMTVDETESGLFPWTRWHPKGIIWEETDSELTITSRRTVPGPVELTGIAFLVSLWFIHATFHPLPMIGLLAYLLAALYLNRTVVHVDASGISVRHRPLPWPSLRWKLKTKDVNQLYIVEKQVHSKVQRGWFGKTGGELVATFYHVNIILRNGWRRNLVSLRDDRDGARYIERKLERFLGVRDVPVLSTPQDELATRLMNKPAPALSVPRLEGGTMRLGDEKGKRVVLLDFWASWCPPCRREMPVLAELAEEYRDRGVVVYAVNRGESPDTIRTFLRESAISLPVGMDSTRTAGRAYGIRTIPTLVVIDRKGVVRGVHTGYSPGLKDELRNQLNELVRTPQVPTAPRRSATPQAVGPVSRRWTSQLVCSGPILDSEPLSRRQFQPVVAKHVERKRRLVRVFLGGHGLLRHSAKPHLL